MLQHFPKARKYVSLYPSTANISLNDADADATVETTTSTSETDAIREEIRQWVHVSMKNGEMDAEPENNLGKHDDDEHWDGKTPRAPISGEAGSSDEDNGGDDSDEDDEADKSNASRANTTVASQSSNPKRVKDKAKKSEKHKKTTPSASKPDTNLTLEGDDFFGSD